MNEITIRITPSDSENSVTPPNSPEHRGAGKLAPAPATVPAPAPGDTPHVTGAERHGDSGRRL